MDYFMSIIVCLFVCLFSDKWLPPQQVPHQLQLYHVLYHLHYFNSPKNSRRCSLILILFFLSSCFSVCIIKACLHSHAIFVALLCATFVVPEFHDENRNCKLAASSMRFVAAMSQRFQTCLKLHATWWQFGLT